MSNTGLITFNGDFDEKSIGIFLHWNGGLESVLAFMEATRERCGGRVGCLGMAQTIANFFEYNGYLHVQLGIVRRGDEKHQNNGLYLIEGDRIVHRDGVNDHEKGRRMVEQLGTKDLQYYETMLAACRATNPPTPDKA